ncbi:hypothetical protein Tco_1010851 [Tanacetum coccineum]
MLFSLPCSLDLCAIFIDFIISELCTTNFLAYQVFAEGQDYGIHEERVRNACWGYLCQSGAMKLKEIAQACRPVVKGLRMWGSVKALGRGYEYLMGVMIFTPVAILAWFPIVYDFQTSLLFNQAFSRGLQI